MPQLYYSGISIKSGQVPSTQTDFPVLVSQIDNRFKTIGNGGHVNNSNGYDIRPYLDSSLGTQLSYELERYNASTGEVVMWVKVGSLTSLSTPIYLGYGDTSLTIDGSSNAAWSNNFTNVYHLKDGTTLSVADSLNANNGINNGVTATTGKVDGAGGFVSASSQYIAFSSWSPAIAITMSAWMKGTTFPNDYNGVITQGSGGSDQNAFFVKSTGKIYVKFSATVPIAYDGTGSHTLSTGTWYFLAFTYSSSAGLVGYVNASSDNTVAANGNILATSTAFDIGRQRSTSSRYFNGVIDEARICSTARSADWITAEYNNQNDPSLFETLEAEQTVLPISGLFRL